MKKMMFTLLLGMTLSQCNAQDKGRFDSRVERKDTLNTEKPRATWKVDKEVDENGNIIRYDSIYSYGYMDSIPFGLNLDSILKGIPFFSDRNLSSFMSERDLDHFFNRDSMMQGDQLFREFFKRQQSDNFPDMKLLMQQIDSLQRTIMGGNNDLLPRVEEESKL